MKYVYLGLSWIFGLFMFLIGAALLVTTPMAGLSLICTSFFLLPPVRNFVHLKTKIELSLAARVASIWLLIVAAVLLVDQELDAAAEQERAQAAKEQAERAAIEKQANIDYFNAHKSEIIASAKKDIGAENYNAVISSLNKYLDTGDEELQQCIRRLMLH